MRDNGQPQRQHMLDAIRWPADLASAEEMLARKRLEALAHGETHVDSSTIVDIIRADRESR